MINVPRKRTKGDMKESLENSGGRGEGTEMNLLNVVRKLDRISGAEKS